MAPQYFKKFTAWAHRFSLDPTHVSCISILGGSHKYVMASKYFLSKLGIPVDVVSNHLTSNNLNMFLLVHASLFSLFSFSSFLGGSETKGDYCDLSIHIAQWF